MDENTVYYSKRYDRTGNFPDGLEFKGYSLVLDSETSIKFYFSCDNISKHSFKFDQEVLMDLTPVEVENGLYYVALENISATDLDTRVRLNIDNDSCFIFACPLSYVYTALSQCKNIPEKEALCNTMRALKKYNDEADNYFNYNY